MSCPPISRWVRSAVREWFVGYTLAEIDQLFEDEGFVTPSCSLVKHSGLVGSVGIMLKSSCRESTGATTPTANVSCVSLNAVGTMPSGPTM